METNGFYRTPAAFTPQAVLVDIALELRAHPERWTRNALARDELYMSVDPDSETARSWCLEGHIFRRARGIGHVASRLFMRAMCEQAQTHCMLAPHQFNDNQSPIDGARKVAEMCEAAAKLEVKPAPSFVMPSVVTDWPATWTYSPPVFAVATATLPKSITEIFAPAKEEAACA